MKDNKAKTKKAYVEAKVVKIDFAQEDIITYSWDSNVAEDGWQ